MNMTTVSRRDDLISLTYLLLYIAQGELDFLKTSENDNEKLFRKVCRRKNRLTAEQLCRSPEAYPLLDFVQTIHDMDFSEEPNYQHLQIMLWKVLHR